MTTSITVGPPTAVAADHVVTLASRLERASADCAEVTARIPLVMTADSVTRSADLMEVDRTVRAAAARFGDLAQLLRLTAGLYVAVERSSAAAIEAVLSQLAAAVGFVAARLGVLLLPGLVNAAATAAALWAILPSGTRDAVAADTAHRLLPSLSHPAVIENIRVALSLLDDAALGAIGVPPTLVAALGEAGAGLSGYESAASAVLGVAALAGVRGTAPVTIVQVGADHRRGDGVTASSPPHTLADRVGRVPEPATPIVIERYRRDDGAAHFEVFIAGTDPHAPLGGDRPWDMLSNVALLAEQPASSRQAVEAAMRAAGVETTSSVVFTGYSQGGAIATVLAESGQWNTAGLVTVGAPTGAIPVTGGYPAIVIEHREDLVPVLSGIRRETTAVVVRGDARDVSSGGTLPAHDFDHYLTTARLADVHDNAALQRAISALPPLPENGERRAYVATRVTSGP